MIMMKKTIGTEEENKCENHENIKRQTLVHCPRLDEGREIRKVPFRLLSISLFCFLTCPLCCINCFESNVDVLVIWWNQLDKQDYAVLEDRAGLQHF